MKKRCFSTEVLCLFFIVSIMVFSVKSILDVKNLINIKINELVPQPKVYVEYQAYSHKKYDVVENLEELNVIDDLEELDDFKKEIKEDKIEIKWLNEKLKLYDEDFFKDNTLVIVCLTNLDNISLTRINSVTKKSDDITIGITKIQKEKANESEKKYTWLSVIEVVDKNKKIKLNIIKI